MPNGIRVVRAAVLVLLATAATYLLFDPLTGAFGSLGGRVLTAAIGAWVIAFVVVWQWRSPREAARLAIAPALGVAFAFLFMVV